MAMATSVHAALQRPWRRLGLVLCFWVMAVLGSRDQQPLGEEPHHHERASPFDDDFRALVADTLADWHVPGIAIAVLDGDDTWTEGFGLAVLPDTPVTPDTLFYTASTTKAFVATALGRLVEEKEEEKDDDSAGPHLAWETPLRDVLPHFAVGDDYWTAHLTVEDALAHRTGLAAHDLTRARRYGAAGNHTHAAGVHHVTKSLRHLPLSAAPRTAWRYCNLMFLVLADVLETLTGRWLGDHLRETLWAPLGMRHTYLRLADAQAAPAPAFLAQGYYWRTQDTAAGAYVPVPHMRAEEASGAGGIVSTVADYARWLRCWLDGPAGCRLLTPALYDAVLAPKMFLDQHTAAPPTPYDAPLAYASAWLTSAYRGHRFYGHSGGSNAFGAQVYFFPEDRFGLVLFGNTASTSNAAELVLLWHLVDERFGIPAADRHDWGTPLRQAAARKAERVDTAWDRLYPDRAQPPLPPPLPLAAYAGTYYHPAYQNLTLGLVAEDDGGTVTPPGRRPALRADRHEYTWPTRCELVHVSGEHWMLYTDMLHERSGHFRGYGRASFVVGADGAASQLVVEFRDADDDTVEGVIPFVRLAVDD